MDCLHCGADIGSKIGLCDKCRDGRSRERAARGPVQLHVLPGESVVTNYELSKFINGMIFITAVVVLYAFSFFTLSRHKFLVGMDVQVNYVLLSALITAGIFSIITWFSLWIQMASTRFFAALALLILPPLLWVIVFTNWEYLKRRFLIHIACVFLTYGFIVLMAHSLGATWHDSFGVAVISLFPALLSGQI